jgi:hypothetical protein
MFKNLLALSLGASALLFGTTAAAFDTEMLQNNGSRTNRVNIIIVGDGYRAEDQTLLREHAVRITDKLWANASFAAYRDFFNVKLVHTISADDGAIGGDNPPAQPTIFGSFFNCSGIDRLLCIGKLARLDEVLEADAPEYDARFDIVLVTVNDSKYGGAGGAYATTSAHSLAPSIAIHELGHSFAGLADEYSDGGKPPSKVEFKQPNVTIFSEREQIKWLHWLDPSTPVPTPPFSGFQDVVGVFEGAAYSTTGHFRPAENCMMRSQSRPFCPVCNEAIVTSIYDKSDPIETRSPTSASVNMFKNAVKTFSIDGPRPTPNTLDVSWWVDNVKQTATGDRFTAFGRNLRLGAHVVQVRVHDRTTAVREDPDNVLSSKATWTLNVISPPSPICNASQQCCDPRPDGSCGMCIPRTASCPM